MNGKRIIIGGLIMIPVFFGLFMLCLYNVLLMFAAVILLLFGMLILKKKKPEMFVRKKPEPPKTYHPTSQSLKVEEQKKTYMILSTGEVRNSVRIAVDKPVFVIGRGAEADYTLNEPNVSRKHLIITYNENDGCCYAEDANSTNHTYRNLEVMTPGRKYPLYGGDRIMIDGTTFICEYAHY